MGTGERRHVIPANSIGFFSPVEVGRRRRRPIQCKRRLGGSPFVTTAENVGWLRGIYGRGKGPWMDHDAFFMPFEALNNDDLSPVLAEREPGKDADLWVKLAAYTASRITRDPQAEIEAAELFAEWRAPATVGYPLNMMRVSAAVLRTRWELLHSPNGEFVLNDRGYAGFMHPVWRTPALLIPLRRKSAVAIGGGQRFPKQIAWENGRWEIEIPTVLASSALTMGLNGVLWNGARAECYASAPELLEEARIQGERHPAKAKDLAENRDLVMSILGSTSEQNREDEMLLYRLLPGIRKPEGGDGHYLWV